MRKFILITLCSCLSACSFIGNKDCLVVEKPNLKLKDPLALNLNSVKFKVLHRDNVQEYFNSSSENQNKSAVFALTESDYKNLSINIEKIKLYIKTQKKIIQLYRNYYEGNQNTKDSKTQNSQKY
jgi:hypothetical protein